MRNLFAGAISLWYGSLLSIPKGYALCNGENGTPDLQNRFVVGAGDTYAVGANNGDIDHQHFFTDPAHNHAMPGGTIVQSGNDRHWAVGDRNVFGATEIVNGLPPYKSLAYIMEL